MISSKKSSYILSLLGGILVFFCTLFLVKANTITLQFDFGTLNTDSFANAYQFVHFNDNGNDFVGTMFFDTPASLSTPQIITGGTSTKTCHKQLRGLYYNNQRGVRLWPLDTTTLSNLQQSGSHYDTMTMSGGLFFDCDGSASGSVYGQITHTFSGTTLYIVAGVVVGTTGYRVEFSPSLSFEESTKIASGVFWDTQGGRAKIQGENKHLIYISKHNFTSGQQANIGSGIFLDTGGSITIVSDTTNAISGSILLSGIQAIVVSGQAWTGEFVAPTLVNGTLATQYTTKLLSGMNLTGSYSGYALIRVGDPNGASLRASGGYFSISVKIPQGATNQIFSLARSQTGNTWSTNTPDATCTLDSQKYCIFRTNHVSIFSVYTHTIGLPPPPLSSERTTIGHNIICNDSDGCICFGSNISFGTTCFSPVTPPTFSRSSGSLGGGSVRLTIDTCTYSSLSSNNLPGANTKGIDYSPSYYDRDCRDISNPKAKLDQISFSTGSIKNSPYSQELNTAYQYSYSLGITTMPTIQKADLMSPIVRKHFAKMITEFAINVLNMKPDKTKLGCEKFTDMAGESSEMKYYIKTSCQLGLMGLSADGKTPKKKFNIKGELTRAQFATVLSRMFYGNKYDNGTPYYSKHLQQLNKLGIIKKITQPEMKELRGRIMLMLMRSDIQFIGSFYATMNGK